MKHFRIFPVVIGVLASLFASTTARSQIILPLTFTVNSTSDAPDANTGDNICDDGTGHCTLRAAIQSSNLHVRADTIEFNIPTTDPGYNPATGAYTIVIGSIPLPDITDGVVIKGLGANKLVLAPSKPFRMINVTTAGTVSISGLDITGAEVSDQAGAGLENVNGGTVNITGCIFENNQSYSSGSSAVGGAAIYNAGSGTINIDSTTFDSNTAYAQVNTCKGGAIWNVAGTITVSKSTFLRNNNSVLDTFGGAIESDGGTVTVTGCTFYQNSSNNGGAIATSGGTMNIINSTFFANIAAGDDAVGIGGAILNGGTLNLSNSTVTANVASSSGSGVTNGYYAHSSAVANVKSTIIAGNLGAVNPDVSGTFVSKGFNLIGKRDGGSGFSAGSDRKGTVNSPVDARLDPLGLRNNGGPTQTVALLTGSPAIDRGSSAGLTGTLATDQRGSPRTYDNTAVANVSDGTDVGAYERQTQ
jgi:CSLREA domain-containing protein